MTMEVDEVVTVAQGLQPNEIASLSVPRLVHDHEWLAVAAYAKASPDQLADTLAHLAGATADPVAFAWFWALVNRPDAPNPDAGWSAFTNMSASVSVPAELYDAVVGFVAEPGGRSAYRDQASGHLLERLPRALGRKAAQAVLDAGESEAPPSREAVHEAVMRLSQQRAATDRNRVLTAITSEPSTERLSSILGMSRPLRQSEIGELQVALEDLAPLASVSPATLDDMWAAWRLLTADGHRSLLVNQVPKSSNRCQAFLTPSLLAPLGTDCILSLLAPGPDSLGREMPAVIAGEIVENLASTGDDFGLELLDLAHGRLDAPSLQPVRQRIAQRMQSWEPARRASGLAAMMRAAVRLADEGIGESLLQAIQPGELTDALATATVTCTASARFLGSWLGRFVSNGLTAAGTTSEQSAAVRGGDVADAIQSLPHRWRAAAVTALAESPLGALPPPVLDLVARQLDLASICVEKGRGASLLSRVGGCGDESTSARERSALLLVIVKHDPTDSIAEGALRLLEADASACDELLGPEEFASRILDGLRGRDALLHGHAMRQMDTLDGSQGAATPPKRLAMVLERALDTGLAKSIDEPCMYISRLVSGHKRLHVIAARWLAEATPTEGLVELCVRADERYARNSPYPSARLAQAQSLAQRVADVELDTEMRIVALESAAAAQPAVGRNAALSVEPDYPVRLRHAAARVLADTRGELGDVERLARLEADEDDKETLSLLKTALRKIHSGNVGEALDHLLRLVDSETDPAAVNLEIVLPRALLHEAFIAKVDAARSSLSGPPAAAVNSLIELGEILVEWAMGNVLSKSPKRQADGRALLDNAPNKPKVGALVRQQLLLQEYPWLSSFAALQAERTVHVAPVGSTKPLRVTDDDVIVARHLMKRVVDGWIQTMYASRDSIG